MRDGDRIGLWSNVTSRAKHALKRVLPPFVADALRAIRRRWQGELATEWEYLPAGWPLSQGDSSGWDHQSVATTQLKSWQAFVDRVSPPNIVSGASESDGEPTVGDLAVHNTLMVFGYVLGLAAWERERISMLDWGGGLGLYAVLAGALHPHLKLDYHCRELPIMARYGATTLPNGHFYDDDVPALARSYDLVMASGSLQYLRNWRECLSNLARVSDGYLFVTRLPVVERAKSFVVQQRPLSRGYQTKYPGWFLNRREFLDATDELRLTLIREFLVWEGAEVRAAPEQAAFRGFLFSAPARREG